MAESNATNSKTVWRLMPSFGIGFFVLLYVIAAHVYPGGSNTDRTAVGFNWQHNYWCDLLGHTAKNGEINSAQPIAMTAMVILSASLCVFWYNLPLLLNSRSRYVAVGQWAGMISMVLVCFIFTPHHDAVINVAGGFGLVALLTTYAGLYKNGHHKLLWLGLFGLLLMGLNQYIYQTGHYLAYLPAIQKFSFVVFLLWVYFVAALYHPNLPEKKAVSLSTTTGVDD